MNDGDLRTELEAMLRKRYEPSFAKQRENQERLRNLSDEEWWEHHIQFSSALDSRSKALYEGAKEHMIEHRFDRLNFLAGDGLQQMIDAEVHRVMPELIRLRLELTEEGPLTEEQYQAASIRSSQRQIAEMSKTLKESVGQQTDPRMRDITAKLAAIVEQDIEDMKILENPELTHEQLDSVTTKMIQRINELTKSLRPLD